MNLRFKKNTKVLCIDNNYSGDMLTRNETYKIIKAANTYLDIRSDDGYIHRFHNSRFAILNNTIKLWTYIIN